MKNANILAVDDNKSILSALNILLTPQCRKLVTLSDPNRLLSLLDLQLFDVILLDMNFTTGVNTGNEGLYWLNRILEKQPHVSVVMITAYGDVELAVRAVRAGAVDFVLKPWDNDKLLTTIQAAIQLTRSKSEVNRLKQKEEHLIRHINSNQQAFIGSSEPIQQMLSLIKKVAATNANVLITGENGTGKELVAREIHRLSPRSNKVMVTVDMGAVAESLFESELFGHVKGAFTDAKADRLGKIEMADGGTLFLDEIGNLSLPMQAKLLSVLQSRQVVRVGDNKPRPVDIRLVCATNANPQQLVADGLFREDLLYRINTIHIEVPPLRQRQNDIVELAEHFTALFARKYNKGDITLSKEASQKLLKYNWPGNVRELQHAIEKAVILSEGAILTINDFTLKTNPVEMFNLSEGSLEEMEYKLISAALQKQGNNLSAVAVSLGISRQTLYNKLRKYGL
jgi:DNA-binding NtrC family response regulator